MFEITVLGVVVKIPSVPVNNKFKLFLFFFFLKYKWSSSDSDGDFWSDFGTQHLPYELFVALCEVKSKSHVHRLKRSGSICPIFWAYFQDNRTSPRITRAIVRRGVLCTKFGGKITIEIGGCSHVCYVCHVCSDRRQDKCSLQQCEHYV